MKIICDIKMIMLKIRIPHQFWLRLSAAIGIFIISGGLCIINNRIPEGILIVELDRKQYEETYKQMIVNVKAFDMPKQYGNSSASLITAKKDYEQILYHELKHDYPKAYIRSLYMERRMRLQAIELLCFILGIHILITFIKLILPRMIRSYTYVLYTVAFFSVCFFVRAKIILPSDWIPAKLIDLQGWWFNIKEYFIQIRQLGDIPSAMYNQWDFIQSILLVLLGISIVIYLVICLLSLVRFINSYCRKTMKLRQFFNQDI